MRPTFNHSQPDGRNEIEVKQPPRCHSHPSTAVLPVRVCFFWSDVQSRAWNKESVRGLKRCYSGCIIHRFTGGTWDFLSIFSFSSHSLSSGWVISFCSLEASVLCHAKVPSIPSQVTQVVLSIGWIRSLFCLFSFW